MGSFLGHAVPGTLFLLLSLWWYLGALIQNSHPRHTSRSLLGSEHGTAPRRKRRCKFNQQVWYSCQGSLLSRIPLEPILKVSGAILGILLELFPDHEYALMDKDGEFIVTHLNNYGHCTMYAFFGLSGAVDLLLWHQKLPLPPGLDYIALATAFLIEGMLFAFHLDGRPQLDVRVHTLLYMIIFATAIITLIEMLWAKNALFSFVRAYLTALQGTWFYQIAFTFYGPKYWKNIPKNVMFLSLALAWHIFLVFGVFLVLFALFHRLCLKRFETQSCLGEEDEEEETEHIVLDTL